MCEFLLIIKAEMYLSGVGSGLSAGGLVLFMYQDTEVPHRGKNYVTI